MFSGSVLLLVLLLILRPAQTDGQDVTRNVDIGVILDLDSYVGKMSRTCLEMAVEDFYGAHRNYTTRLVLHSRDSRSNAVEAASAGESDVKTVMFFLFLFPPLLQFATLILFSSKEVMESA